MSIKTVTNGIKSFKLGRKRPLARCPRLSLRNYLMASLPKVPETYSGSKKTEPILHNILGNDTLGDCTAAGAFHIIGSMLANANKPCNLTAADTIQFYENFGYNPNAPLDANGNNPTDQGADEQTVLNFWKQHGLLKDGSHKTSTWIAVDGNNIEECRTALWLFGNLYFGVELPDEWVNPAPAGDGFLWTSAGEPDPNNGHCFISYGNYDEVGVNIDSWGLEGKITWRAIAKYAATSEQGELYTVLSSDLIRAATQKSPTGVDWSQLTADIESMHG